MIFNNGQLSTKGGAEMFSRFILPLVIIAFVPVTAPAQESSSDVIRPRIEAPYITGKIKLDGSASDWKRIKKMGRGISFYKGDGHEGTPTRLGTTVERIITDENDLRVDFWAAHDGIYLYFLAEVHDDFYEPFDRSRRCGQHVLSGRHAPYHDRFQ